MISDYKQGGIQMKKCLFSQYIKTEKMDIIRHDIELFQTMKQTAFSNACILGGDQPLKEDLSLHMFLKEQFSTSDYFTNSARNEGIAAYKSAMELLSLQKDELESRIKQMNRKIKDTEKRLLHLRKEKESLIRRSKTGKGKFASYRGGKESEIEPGIFQVSYKKRVDIYKNQYLFETQYLDPELKKLKARIRMISQRLTSHQCRLQKIEKMIENHHPSVCFGSKKLFRKQSTVYVNQHEHWERAFYKRRNPGMTISGRKDATQGNFLFRYDPFRYTLTYKATNETAITLKNVKFPYGQEYVNQAVLATKEERKAIAWRLEIHDNRILVKCMVELPEIRKNQFYENGCVSFDTNVDHIAYTEIDGCGNLLFHKIIPFQLHGKSTGQREQILSQALEEVFLYAREKAKPIVMEQLKDIKQKPMYQHKRLNEKLSSFAYTKVALLAESKSNKYAIECKKVNPAFTSQIGKMKYMRHYGLSVHEAAAFVIGRRGMRYQDYLPKAMKPILPKTLINKHHWSHWRYYMIQLKQYPSGAFYQKVNYEIAKSIKEIKTQLAS